MRQDASFLPVLDAAWFLFGQVGASHPFYQTGACVETLPPVAHFFWRCFRRTGAGDKVSDDPAALNAAGRFLPSGPEAFLKTLGFCLTLSFSVLKLQTHSTNVYICISTVSANILHVENIVHVDKLALE